MATGTEAEWPTWIRDLLSGMTGGLLTYGTQRLTAKSTKDIALQETIDSRIKLILQDDERTIRRLNHRVGILERYVQRLVTVIAQAGLSVPVIPDEDPDDANVTETGS